VTGINLKHLTRSRSNFCDFRRLRFALVGAIGVLLLAGSGTPAQAIKVKTSEFAQMCSGKVETVEQDINRVICLSYLQGLIDAHDAMITLFPPAVLYGAPPSRIEVEHVREIFLAWTSENRADYEARPADITFISALNAAFPCAK